MVLGSTLITEEEFKEAELGVSLTGIDDEALLAIIGNASRAAEGYARRVWPAAATQYTEMHPWRNSRMLYVRHWPVTSIEAVTVHVGTDVAGTLDVANFLINNDQRYIEMAETALVTGITGAFITMGLAEPLFEITYKAGVAAPNDVKVAVAYITAAMIIQRRLIEEGVAGVRSFAIGSYMVTIGRGEGEQSGFAGIIPDVAKALLDNHKMTAVR